MNESTFYTFGEATNTSLIDFGGTMENNPDANIWYDTATGLLLNNIYPFIDNKMTPGKSGLEFAKFYINTGIR